MQWKNRNLGGIHEAVNLKSGGKADAFLNPDRNYCPIQNADIMAGWLAAYVIKRCPITIMGDYDVDGVSASAGLYLTLIAAGAEPDKIRVRLPKRMSEGYGLKDTIVDEVDSGVIVTVDNGIAALSAIKKAKEKGLVVLVIDHHQPVMENGRLILPCADLIVDPHVEDSLIAKEKVVDTTYRDYCGAGLVFKIAQYLIPGKIELDWVSALAAIATVADVMPLTGDNRNIYHEGIWNIQRGHVPVGLQAILDLLKTGNMVTESDIGFKIAPMLNAPGRIYDDGAGISLAAVLTQNVAEAQARAQELSMINNDRKGMKEEAVKRAVAYVESHSLEGINPVIVFDPMTPEGIVGLVAGELQERYNATAIVFTQCKAGLKGSARAIEADDIKKALDAVHDAAPDLFLGYGGHKQAAGVSIKAGALNEFYGRMQQAVSKWQPKPDYIEYDMELEPGKIMEANALLQRYAPFGQGNPPVVFRIRNFRPVPIMNSFYKEVGKDSVKFVGAGCEAIGFSLLEKYKEEKYPVSIDLVGTLGYHYFMGNATTQVEILDLKASAPEPVKRSSLFNSIAGVLKANNVG